MRKLTAIVVCLAVSGEIHADYKTATQTTVLSVEAQEAKGSKLRSEVNAAGALIKAKRLAEAEKALVDLASKFESQFDPGLAQFVFQSKAEYDEYKQAASAPFEWIDWGYKQCLQFQAFIHSERKEFDQALKILGRLEKLAPVSVDTACETGYILNQLGKFEDGLSAYNRGCDLAKRYASQKSSQAIALRGAGFSLGELGRFDEAEKKYRESLEIEPNNQVALGEIRYLQDQRRKK